MRTFFGVILLAAVLTGALLWNDRSFVPEPARAARREADPVRPEPPPPTDPVILILGRPPGPAPDQAPAPSPPAPRVSEEPPPAPGLHEVTREEPEAAPRPEATRRVRLQRGETVYGLAERLLGKGARYREILELNELSEGQARRLKEGTLLRLPPR